VIVLKLNPIYCCIVGLILGLVHSVCFADTGIGPDHFNQPLENYVPLLKIAGYGLFIYLALGTFAIVFILLHVAFFGFLVNAFYKKYWRGKWLKKSAIALMIAYCALIALVSIVN
jgi:hypothetical protein